MKRAHPHPATLLALALLPAVQACRVERRLVITGRPEGSRVLLDDTVVGDTPLRERFDYYGVRRVCLSHEGYRTSSQLIEIDAPWYARFPLDIVSEVLLPIGWKDIRHLRVDLQPGEETIPLPDLRSVIERANLLRQAGAEGPKELPPVQPRVVPRVDVDPLGEPPPGAPEGSADEKPRRLH